MGALLLAPLLAEGIARLQLGPGEALPPIFAAAPDGRVRLAPGATALARFPGVPPHRLEIDDRGLRAPAPAAPRWLVAGDSLAFGLGVDGRSALAAQLTDRGLAAATAAVPGDSLAQALATADDQLAAGLGVAGVLVLPNPADDPLQQRDPRAAARVVVAGRPLAAASPRLLRRLARSPLARSRLLSQLSRGVQALALRARAPDARADPEATAAALQALGDQIRAFAADHPATVVRAAWLPPPTVPPADAARWQAALSAGLAGLPCRDLGPALAPASGAPSFLSDRIHLSPTGHARAAADLAPWLAGALP